MGAKYVIELEDWPFVDSEGNRLWKAKGFNSLVFDKNGLSKLTRLDDEIKIREKNHGWVRKEKVISAISGDPPDAHYPSWYVEIVKDLQSEDIICPHCGRKV